MEQKTESFNAVQKALRILLAFQVDKPSWGIRELSAHLGFSPATVQRLLGTLKEYAFVDQDPRTRQYRLGNVYYQFLHVLHTTYPVAEAASPFLKELSARTRETVHFNLIHKLERICVESIESMQHLKGSMPIGETSPLYAGASSRCLLAFSPLEFTDSYLQQVELTPLTPNTPIQVDEIRSELEAIRRRGYAVSMGERTPGLGSLSAPVFDHNGTLLGAISVALPELRFADDSHRGFCLAALLDVSRRLSSAMGYRATATSATKEGNHAKS